MANDNFGAGFSIDITNLKAGLAAANKLIRESEAQFKAAAAGMDDWSKSQEGLERRVDSLNKIVDVQAAKVDALKREKERIISTMQAEGKSHDEIARAVDAVNGQIIKESNTLDKQKGALDKAKNALDDFNAEQDDAADSADKTEKELDDMGESAKESGDGFTVAKGAIAGFIADGLSALVSKIGETISSIAGLADETREYRNEMAMLDTSFETAGLSAEAAQNTFRELYGVMGDEGAATEAAQQLAKIADNEQELESYTRILTGVMAEYGNSIPTEGLAEGIAATAAMGEVQGVLADALEWQGVNLDDFNARLATMSTEEERAAYIQETLTGLYGESADAFRENNASVIEANEAQADYNDTIADTGAAIEPLMTTIKSMGTDMLASFNPFIELIGEGLTDALNGTEGAADKLAEGIGGAVENAADKIGEFVPIVIDTLTSLIPEIVSMLPSMIDTLVNDALPQLLTGLTTIVNSIIESLPAIVESLASALPSLIPQLIDALVSMVVTLAENATDIIMPIIDYLPEMIASLSSALMDNLPALLQGVITLVVELCKALPDVMMIAWDALALIWKELAGKLGEMLAPIWENAKSWLDEQWAKVSDFFSEMWAGITDAASGAWDKIKEVFGVVKTWFNDTVITPVKDFFSDTWKGLKDGASDAWKGIKNTFSKVATFFKDIFSSAWQKVKDVFSTGGKIFDGIKEGITSAFKNIVNAIIRGINKVVAVPFNAINTALKKIKNVEILDYKPFQNLISTISVPQIPELAEGGIVNKATQAIIGEAGKEAVLPLERNTGWMDMLAERLASKIPAAAPTVNQYNTFAQAHSRYEIYKSNQQMKAAVRLAMKGA